MNQEMIANTVLWLKVSTLPNSDSENRMPETKVRVSSTKAMWISWKSSASMVSSGGRLVRSGVSLPRCNPFSATAIRIA